MAKKLKIYQTSLGFLDLATAAPSMKAALEAWGADSNLFHQGAARKVWGKYGIPFCILAEFNISLPKSSPGVSLFYWSTWL